MDLHCVKLKACHLWWWGWERLCFNYEWWWWAYSPSKACHNELVANKDIYENDHKILQTKANMW
jgi:hypothetical protein